MCIVQPKVRWSQAGQNILYNIVQLANKRPNIAHSVNNDRIEPEPAQNENTIVILISFQYNLRKVKIIQN